MEANNDNDKLGKFVRAAFEDYEELPSGGIWNRIEVGLSPPRWSWTRYRWSVAAAGAILLLASGLICQHLYYKEKIQTLSKTHPAAEERPVADHNPALAPLPENTQKIDNPFDTHNAAIQPLDPASSLRQDGAPEKKAGDAIVDKDSPDLPVRGKLLRDTQKQQTPNGIDFFGERGKGVAQDREQGEAAAVPQSQTGLHPGDTRTLSSPNKATAAGGTPSDPATQVSAAENTGSPSETDQDNNTFSNIPALPAGPFATLQKTAPVATLPVPSLIKPARTPSGWYVGLYVAPSLSTEKIPASNRPLPPWGGGPRKPEVANERETTAYATDVWLKAGKKLNRHIALESGIGFRSIARSAKHKPSFEFRDGRPQGGGPHGGGGHPKCFDFNYQLDAYGGTASVSLRMTQVDSAVHISDKEPIGLEIKTIQRARILKIPLLAAVNVGKGRFNGVLKAGLVGNFVLKNELEIEGLNSLNNKFHPEPPTKPKPDFAAPKKFIPGYWASAAVEYRLGRHWSALVEPTITGDFPTQTGSGRAMPRDFSTALNLGLHYYF